MEASKIKINISVEKPAPTEERGADLPRSGSSYTEEQLRQMCSGMLDAIDRNDPIDDMFVTEFMAGMGFSTVSENAETYGMSACEFARNSYGWCLEHVAALTMHREIARVFGK